MKHLKTISVIIIVIAIVAMIASSEIKREKEKKYREYLLFHGSYAIGTYKEMAINSASNIPTGIVFSLIVDNKKFSTCDFHFLLDKKVLENDFISDTDLKFGDQFLVLYERKNPKKAIIRLDCPIKDSSDFKNYVHEFEEMRKQKNN